MPVLLALPEVAALVLGALALLLYLAWPVLRQYLSTFFAQWAVLSWFVDATIGSWLDSAWQSASGWFLSMLHPIVGFFSAPAANMDAFAQQVVNSAQAAVNRDQFIAGTLIPASAQAATANALAVAQPQVDSLDLDVLNLQSQVDAIRTDQLYPLDLDVLNLQSQIASLREEVQGTRVEGAIDQLDLIVLNLGTQVNAINAAAAALGGKVTSVAEEAAGAYTYTDTQVAAGVKASEEVSAAFTLSAIAPIAATVAEVTQFVDECGTPMCNWFNGDPAGLGSIFGLVELAGIAALIEAAITDPSGAATVVADAADTIKSLGESTLSLIGVSL